MLSLYPKKRPSRPLGVNTSISAPGEIFINAFSNFPIFRLEQAYYKVDRHDWLVIVDTRYFSSEYGTRHRVLFASARPCCSMRQKFLPWLWECVQCLCIRPPRLEEHKCRRMTKEFRRKPRPLAPKLPFAVRVKYVPLYLVLSLALAQAHFKNILREYVPVECSRSSETPSLLLNLDALT